MDKDELVAKIKEAIEYGRSLDGRDNSCDPMDTPLWDDADKAADALSRSRDEALEEAAKIADKYGVYWNASKIAEKIRALKIAAPQASQETDTSQRQENKPAESATVVVPREVWDWLMGEGDDFEPTEAQKAGFMGPGHYWWRSQLREKIAAAQGEGKP